MSESYLVPLLHLCLEICGSSIIKYFTCNYESGIRQIQFLLENPREFLVPTSGQFCVDCPRTTLVHRYEQGSQINISGHLRILYSKAGKIDKFEFFGIKHEELFQKTFLSCTFLS